MNTKIDCLPPHGFVRLLDHMGNDLSIARAARVSFAAEWRAGEDEGKDAKLIHRLWRDKHTSPFECVCFSFEISLPIFICRQWHRHRTQSYSELSGRYRELPETYYLPDPNSVGVQSKDNKQGRTLTGEDRRFDIERMEAHCKKSFELYHELLAADWPKELARTILPLATFTHMFTSMNLLNLFRFLTLRCDSHAQMEIRVYADAMLALVRPVVPVAVAAWEAYK